MAVQTAISNNANADWLMDRRTGVTAGGTLSTGLA
jgi:hypothetical protein